MFTGTWHVYGTSFCTVKPLQMSMSMAALRRGESENYFYAQNTSMTFTSAVR